MSTASATAEPMNKLLLLCTRLDVARIHYQVTKYLPNAVSIVAIVPGERWEIDVHDDGQIGVEVFKALNGVRGEERLDDLFTRFSEPANPTHP